MAFDYTYALEKVNAAVSKLILRGPMPRRLGSAMTELASPGLSLLPKGNTRDLADWIFAQTKDTPASAMGEEQAEEVGKAIWELRARLETDKLLGKTL